MFIRFQIKWLFNNIMSKLYVVGTPIGNLKDITFRAVEVLRGVDIILCEDTRVTRKLLSAVEIKNTLLSYHSHSGITKVEKIKTLLEEGKNLALVSDAGTPSVSDPGSALVAEVRRVCPDVEIFTVPGPSALTSAVSIAGVPVSEFLFLGFLPRKKGRKKLFQEIAISERTVVFYESPHRIIRTLVSLKEILGKDKKVTIARELTKIHEEVFSGTAEEVLCFLEQNNEKVRGEFVVLVSG